MIIANTVISLSDLRYKEVISVVDGSRFGFVGDLKLEQESGKILSLIILGRPRFFGIFGRDEDLEIPWGAVQRFGEEVILIEHNPLHIGTAQTKG